MTARDILRLIRIALDEPLFTIAGTSLTLFTLLLFCLITWMSLRFSGFVQKAIAKAFNLRGIRDEGRLGLVQRLTHYALVGVGLGIALSTLGIDLGALFAAGAVFAVGIGFAMQTVAQNFVSGIILLIEQSIRPGDVLRVEGELVRVEEMGIRSTVVRTRDGDALIVPNTSLAGTAVRNYCLSGQRLHRVCAVVGVSYESDLHRVQEALEGAAAALPGAARARRSMVTLEEFADSSVVFHVYAWTEDPWNMRPFRHALNRAVWWALKDAGVTIAFPQVDVHLSPPSVEGLRALVDADP